MHKAIKIRMSTHKVLYFLAFATFGTGCSQQVSYENDVSPILQSNCLTCHTDEGEGLDASGFSVRTYDELMKGTKFGPVIIPGDSVSSTLYRLVDHKADHKIQMPPHHKESTASEMKDPLTQKQINTIKLWIDQGAQNN
jgi:hypothetical protein